MTYTYHDLIGNIGIILILWAYAALQVGRMTPGQMRYNILNGLGAAFILFSLIFKFNLSAFLIELAWLVISLYGLAKSLRLKGQERG